MLGQAGRPVPSKYSSFCCPSCSDFEVSPSVERQTTRSLRIGAFQPTLTIRSFSRGARRRLHFTSPLDCQPAFRLIQPEMRIAIKSLAYPASINRTEMKGLTLGKDVFHRPRGTQFCVSLLRDLSGFGACDKYNDTDD